MPHDIKLSIEHPDIVAAASRAFWDACRVDLAIAIQDISKTPWRRLDDEYADVKSAIEAGMAAAIEKANEMAR